MKVLIKQVIFTDKKQDGTPLVRNWNPFFMLHLQLNDWKWLSKFYNHKELYPTWKIEAWKEYDIDYKQNGQYFNLLQLKDLLWNIII